jgi:hypothetical protein
MNDDPDDEPDADSLKGLSRLRHWDVSRSHASRLRRRCHATLAAERTPQVVGRAPLRRVALPAFGAAWCLAYLAEILRFSAAIYTAAGTR